MDEKATNHKPQNKEDAATSTNQNPANKQEADDTENHNDVKAEENERDSVLVDETVTYSQFDLDIHQWANEKLGDGFVRESVDFSDIKIKQKSVVYYKQEDFLTVNQCFVEDFDNPGNMPLDWVYLQDFTTTSHLTWQIQNGFSSQYLPIKNIKIEALPVDKEHTKLDTVLETLQDGHFSVLNSSQHVFNIKRNITVAPYEQTRVYTELRSWQLKNCHFYCDFVISGFVKILGHRKRKKWVQQEVKAGIEDLFINKEGYDVIKTYGSDPEVIYKMIGVCNGDVVIGAKVHVQESTTV